MAIYGTDVDSYRQVREENIVDLAPLLGRDVLEMQDVARRLHHLYENACNYELSPGQEKRQERLEKRATAIAAEHGLECHHQRDPRGWPLKVFSSGPLPGLIQGRELGVCPF